MVITVFHAFLASVVLPVGGTVQGPEVVTVDEFKVEIPVPEGWKAMRGSENALVLGQGDGEGAVFVLLGFETEEELVKGLMKTQQAGSIPLVPALPAPKLVAGLQSMRYQPPSPGSSAFGIARSVDERSISAVGVVPEANQVRFAATAASILKAAKFAPMPPNPLRDKIAGSKFTYRDVYSDSTGSGRSTTRLLFCSDGTFVETTRMSHSTGSTGIRDDIDLRLRSNDSKRGRWTVDRSGEVTLRYDDGTTKRRRLHKERSRLMLGIFKAAGESGC